MSLLIPLGLLGLLGLAVLLIIYIIKPNYQQKLVSSTFIWKLSLKYKKKRIPINKLRNLLLLLCQILILILLAFILAQPAVVDKGMKRDNEKVAVIDASASMLAVAQYDEEKYTRFERAVDEVIELANETFEKDGTLTIILAGAEPETLFFRVKSDAQSEVFSKLAELKSARDESFNPAYCTYGSADIAGAMAVAETVTVANPMAEVLLYTGKTYLNKNGVNVVDMSRGAEEINVAILDVRAVLEEGYYTFYADVVSYGGNSEVDIDWLINVSVYGGVDAEPVREKMHKYLYKDEVTTVVFDTNSKKRADGSDRPVTDYVYEYFSATASTSVKGDAIAEDNSVTLYGGVKPMLKVQYASISPNIFFSSALMSIANALRNRWDVDIDEVRGTSDTPKTNGYDLYIFEHRMPASVPTDGVVILVNPTGLPNELGVMLGSAAAKGTYNLLAPEAHPLVNFMNVNKLSVSTYTPINTYPEGFTPVMLCEGRPVVISKNTADEKIAIMTFSLNYSDIAVTFEFPTFIYNIFEYFIPSTFTQFIFEVNDSITLKARGASLDVTGGGVKNTYTEFPTELTLTQIGTYTTSQTLFGGISTITENFFVQMPPVESNIGLVIDVMPGSVVKPIPSTTYDDLLIYFAAALVLLLFIEWWLQSRSRI
ncbi:MAG: VWA domain-containing protein [Clostridiales bacterium]|nr:VWA domain-containing protein [Clostridiales bacterium]